MKTLAIIAAITLCTQVMAQEKTTSLTDPIPNSSVAPKTSEPVSPFFDDNHLTVPPLIAPKVTQQPRVTQKGEQGNQLPYRSSDTLYIKRQSHIAPNTQSFIMQSYWEFNPELTVLIEGWNSN